MPQLQFAPAAVPAWPLRRYTLAGPTMGTRFSAVFYTAVEPGLDTLRGELQAAVDRVDNQMSTWKEDSDLSRLNQAPLGEWVDVPGELLTVVSAGLEIARASGGAFEIGVGELVDAWGFGPRRRQPDAPSIAQLASSPRRPTADLIEVDTNRSRIVKRGPVAFDLSGIAKGFGVDQLAECLERFGITRYLVSIDGEVRASGLKPGGAPWMVAVEQPVREVRDAARVQEVSDIALATSGDYRHFAEHEGATISHTMDPRTGRPVVNTLASVTVAASTCMVADAWATALIVLGLEAAMELANRLGIRALLMFREAGTWKELAVGGFE
ncbi:MAG: apbE [Devosia sp.]|nr:apbE [Devosia sp.]